jgi:hypothetical protein
MDSLFLEQTRFVILERIENTFFAFLQILAILLGYYFVIPSVSPTACHWNLLCFFRIATGSLR